MALVFAGVGGLVLWTLLLRHVRGNIQGRNLAKRPVLEVNVGREFLDKKDSKDQAGCKVRLRVSVRVKVRVWASA